MKKHIRFLRTILIYAAALTVAFIVGEAQAQLSINGSIPLETLVRNHFIGGGAQVSNITYQGNAVSIGYFNGVRSNIGIDEGVLLTSGSIFYAIGPNTMDDITYPSFMPGDPDLANLVHFFTLDAAVLEFDFVPYQDSVHFEYVFASEEYTEFVGSVYNDVFAFFISGPGIVGKQNIALIPGTTTPVAINSVNHLEQVQYYINNYGGATVEYDGFTTVLKASAKVIPCQSYHLKLAIADVSDNLLDSGVFLKSGSFDAGNLFEVVAIQDAPEGGCVPGIIEVQRLGNVDNPLTLKYYVQGDATNGDDYTTIPDSITFSAGQSAIQIPINALRDSVKDGGEWVTIYIEDICGTGLVRDSIKILEIPDMELELSGDTVICIGSEITLRAQVAGGSNFLTLDWNGLGDSPELTIIPQISRPFAFSVFDSLTGCRLTDTVHVKVEKPPAVSAGPDKVICPGGSAILEGEVVGGTPPFQIVWTPMTALSNPGMLMPEASPSSTTTYILTVTSATGCVARDTVVVRVSAVVIDAGTDTTICNGSGLTIGGVAGGGVPPYTYQWEPAAEVGNPSLPYTTAAPTATTTYRLTVRSSNNCIAVDSVTITVSDIALDAGPDLRLCAGEARVIGDTAWTTHAPVSYVWEPEVGLDSRFIPTPTASPTVSTTYTVVATNRYGCVMRDTVYVEVNDLEIDAGGPHAICPGDSVQLAAAVLSGSTPYVFRWDAASSLSATDINNPFARPAMSTWYSLTVIDGAGCAATDSVLVTVWPLPTVEITPLGSPVFCLGDSVRLDAGSGFASYRWSTGETTRSITVRDPGWYQVAVTSADGCSAVSDSMEVIVSERPSPRITGPLSLCENEKGVYSVPEVPGSTYNWTVTGGFITEGHGTSSITVLFEDPGSYPIRIEQVFGSASCRGDTLITVTVHPNPEPVISANGPLAFCEGESVMLLAPAGFARYEWSTGDSTRQITVVGSGSYSVRVVSAEGCEGVSPPVEVTILPPPEPVIAILTPLPVCDGGEIILGLTESYTAYAWSTGSDQSSIAVTSAGYYRVHVTNDDGCSAWSDSVFVEFAPLPDPEIAPDGPLSFCQGDSVRLFATELFVRYLWNTGDTTSSIVVRSSGNYSVRVWTADGCDGLSNELTVTVYDLPPLPVITRDGSILTSTPAAEYQWYHEIDGRFIRIPGAQGQEFTAVSNRRYIVEIKDRYGCTAISLPYRWTEEILATSTVLLPSLEAYPGDIVTIDLRLVEQQYLSLMDVHSFEAEVAFNGSLLVPTGSTPQGRLENGFRIIPVEGEYDSTRQFLSRMQFLATLGNAESTPLLIRQFFWNQPDVEITTIAGEFSLGICREGGDRLFDATGQLTLEPNHPNPFNAMTIITYEIIERGHTELYVMDMLGRRVATLVAGEVEAGRYQVAFDAGRLPSGMYISVLHTPTQVRMQRMKLLK